MEYSLGKQLIYPSRDEKGVYTFLIDELVDHKHLIKTATEYHPEVAQFIRMARPIHGHVQALITALGAGEAYGPNVNGDFFPTTALSNNGKDYGHKTFEYYAKVRKHHLNKDHHPSYGDVMLAVWNDRMKRVELILKISQHDAPDLAQSLARGETVDWSMGAKLPWDECSICANRATKREEYCGHLKFLMNQIDPETGKQVYAINRQPRFFDISHVLLGADRTNATWTKVAKAHGSQNDLRKLASVTLYNMTFGKMAAQEKKADIEKNVASNIKPAFNKETKQIALETSRRLQNKSPDLPNDLISLLSMHPLHEVLSTMLGLGIIPKPHEFQSIVLRSAGKEDLAKDLEEKNITFNPAEGKNLKPIPLNLGPEHLSGSIAELLRPMIESRSFARPVLMKRIIILSGGREPDQPKMVKSAAVNIPILATLAAMFTTLAWRDKGLNEGALDKILMENPALTAALGAGALAGARQVRDAGAQPTGFFDVASGEKPLYNNSNRLDLFRRLQQRPVMLIKTSSAEEKSLESRLFHGLPKLLEVAAITSAQGGSVAELDHSLSKIASSLGAGLVTTDQETITEIKEAIKSSSRVMGKVASVEDLELFPSRLRECVCDLSIMNQMKKLRGESV